MALKTPTMYTPYIIINHHIIYTYTYNVGTQTVRLKTHNSSALRLLSQLNAIYTHALETIRYRITRQVRELGLKLVIIYIFIIHECLYYTHIIYYIENIETNESPEVEVLTFISY